MSSPISFWNVIPNCEIMYRDTKKAEFIIEVGNIINESITMRNMMGNFEENNYCRVYITLYSCIRKTVEK